MQRPALSDNPRPLPPLPLLFSSSSVAGNVRLLEKGQGAEWGPELVLGVCGLNRALQKGQGVKVEVKGTGHFNVILRKRAFAASLEKSSSRGDRGRGDDVVKEVKFKLRKSWFLIEVERTSRTHLHILATATGARTSKADVTLPSGVDPWLTFNVVFGNLRLTVRGGEGKNEKPWHFQNSHGINICKKSKQEVESLLYNPCSTVVTERPLDQGETMEMSVEPQSENCQSQVKIFLTHTTPSTLKLQNPRTYFNERKVLDRFLTEVCIIRKFKGTLTLRVDTETECIDVEEITNDAEIFGARASHSFSLNKLGLDAHKPLYICLELFRVSVRILQKGRCLGAEPAIPAGYALALPGQAMRSVPEYLVLPAMNDYLTPIADTGPPSKPPALNPPGPYRPPLSPSACSLASSFTSSCSAQWISSSSSSTTPSPSPRKLDGRNAIPSSADRNRFFPIQNPTPAIPDTPVLSPAPCSPRMVPSLTKYGPYIPMGGYVLPSSSMRAKRIPPVAPPKLHPDYLTPISPSRELAGVCVHSTPAAAAAAADLGCKDGADLGCKDGADLGCKDGDRPLSDGGVRVKPEDASSFDPQPRQIGQQSCIVLESSPVITCPSSVAESSSHAAGSLVPAASSAHASGTIDSSQALMTSPSLSPSAESSTLSDGRSRPQVLMTKSSQLTSGSSQSAHCQLKSTPSLAFPSSGRDSQRSSGRRKRQRKRGEYRYHDNDMNENGRIGEDSSRFQRNLSSPSNIVFPSEIIAGSRDSFDTYDKENWQLQPEISTEKEEEEEQLENMFRHHDPIPLPLKVQRDSAELTVCCAFPFRGGVAVQGRTTCV